jgi:thiamine pyrophosphate-dependent acetolactate synthase large subunit-like protein
MIDRRKAVARLLRDRGDMLVVTGLGGTTYDVSSCGDHEHNYYLWGAMGGAVAMGLGLALAQPERRVLVITGDGEAMMGLGSFATVGRAAPSNLAIIVVDNGLYGETGAQEGHSAHGTDIAAVARGCGIADAQVVLDEASLENLADRLSDAEGPVVAVLKVDRANHPREVTNSIRDAAYLKGRFRKALGLRIE